MNTDPTCGDTSGRPRQFLLAFRVLQVYRGEPFSVLRAARGVPRIWLSLSYDGHTSRHFPTPFFSISLLGVVGAAK